MSAATAGRHALLPEPKPRRRLRLPRRRPQAPVTPDACPAFGEVPASPGEQAQPAPVLAFTGASQAGLPDTSGGDTADLLERVRDGIRNIRPIPEGRPEPADQPETELFAVISEEPQDSGPPDGQPGSEPSAFLRAVEGATSLFYRHEALHGRPSFAGITRAGGCPAAGLRLGAEADGDWFVADVMSTEWLDDLIEAATEARDALLHGQPAPEPQVFTAAAPAAPADEHTAVLMHCWGIWSRALSVSESPAVQAGALELEEALGLYGRLVNGLTAPERAFPELASGCEHPHRDAEALAAERAAGEAGRLIGTVLAECGEEAAEFVRGLEGGTQ
ncbi:MAG TPA: hypothetical protein VFB06_11090 [Streptosporangiaceae bacterium]|nr:hypothetical protein [Streptosporangiaceae bacterium]